MILNKQQLEIVNHTDGPCLVAAVPGSGKTASLTERIKRLIIIGKNPSKILAITFTNKAANEMKKRISCSVGKIMSNKMTICTFHSLCVKILREFHSAIGYNENFTIYDEDDQERLVKDCMIKINENAIIDKYHINPIILFMERQRNSLLSDEETMSVYPLIGNQYLVIKKYYEELKKSNSIDFTGLLYETINLLQNNVNVLSILQKRWDYISIDEVQDTNRAQYEIIKLLAEKHRNILCCGDPDQSIYMFRNANPENLFKFEKYFKAKVLKLETNYRSSPEILTCAQSLIKNNKLRKDTELKTNNPSKTFPKAFKFKNDTDMANFIGDEISKLICNGANPSEIAILYRVNYASRILEHSLRNRNIKYKIIGGVSFYDRKEVKQSMAILRLLCNPNDKTAFEKSVEACCKNVGPKTISLIYDLAENEKCSLLEAAQKIQLKQSSAASGLYVFIKNLRTDLYPYDALSWVLNNTCFRSKLEKDSTRENDRCANVNEIVTELSEFIISNKGKLDEYLQFISLISSQDDEGSEKEVKLMTMHSAKGLEFENVFISHVNQEIIPHWRVLLVENENDRINQIEEERRLLYVAMTRAKIRLEIHSCYMPQKNNKYDGKTKNKSIMLKESQFISETSIKLLDYTNAEDGIIQDIGDSLRNKLGYFINRR